MIDFDSLVSDEILLAPPHPLAGNLELPTMDANRASFVEIQEVQQRLSNQVSAVALDQVKAEPLGTQLAQASRIPGIVKRIIPLDNDTSWEYWWCVPDRLLLPEDVELMMSDRHRVEGILEKLVWLFGGHCFGQECSRQGNLIPVHEWQEVLKFAQQRGFESYLLDVDYLPTAIKPYNQESHLAQQSTDTSYIAVEPAHWHIEFFQLTTTQGGFEIQQPKTICSCQIWIGKPFLKNLHTGKTTTRYDLWISRPLDLTQPPWFNSNQ